MSMAQTVYFAQEEKKNGKIKIGYSANLEQRRKAIETLNPTRIKVLGSVKGREHLIHRMFKDYKVDPSRPRHEWFDPHPRLLAFIKQFATA